MIPLPSHQSSTTSSEWFSVVKTICDKYLSNKHSMFLFGSRSRQMHTDFSDIDVCIKGPPLSSEDITKIKDELSESDLPVFVDIVQYEQLSEEFKRAIDTELRPL
ncbi:nucleotidyltransferase family protein [Aestuariibacter salexigens]|uniref:nucleotidyltransferase family protein n=1 Tax=Aestuariibacter salexigens TaxID=226010 RepID=UPI000683EA58|nr:nucleotidyltransferase domain-containing protein [Aestuariibacter salexigens]